MEFSLSANVGLTYREDLEPRMRKIELAYFEEDPNTRMFQNRFLHRSVLEHRPLILSAIASLYQHWAQEGFPPGPTPFVSYPQWAEVIGGVMVAVGLGDPCLPFQSDYDTGGDLKTAAMAELFKVCHETLGEKWVRKKEIYQCVQKAVTADDNELLGWFGALEGAEDSRKNQSKLGRLLRMFKNRVLLNMRLAVDESSAKSERHQYRFVPAGATPKPEKLPKSGQNAQKSPPEVGTSGTLGTSKGSPLTRGDISLDAHAIETGCVRDVKNTSCGANEPLEAPKVPDVPTCSAFDLAFYPKILALDLETYGVKRLSKIGKPLKGSLEALNPWKGDIRLVTLADDSGAISQFDLHSQQLPQHILDAISRGPLVIHNAAFDLSFLAVKLGLSLPDEVFCTLTASRLLEPSRQTKHRLGDVVERWLGAFLPKELGSSDWGAETLSTEQIEYACNDVRFLQPLKTALETALGNAGLTQVFELESQLIPVVARMEQRGFAVDAAALQRRCEKAKPEQEMLGMHIRHKLNAPELNPSSWQQLLAAFKGVGIELPDTDELTLSTLSHEAAPLILEYRHADKLRSSAATLLKHVQSDGRIHARFNPLGARTGRFSSSSPNLQNVPRGELRKCFIPSGPDRKLIVADYAQIELRIAALVANAVELQKMFQDRGFDMHQRTAEAILCKAPERLLSNGRQLAKAVNFGFLYGQGAKGFQGYALTCYGIALTPEEATEFRTTFFQHYSELRRWHAGVWNQVKYGGVKTAKTLCGRLLLPDKDEEWQRFQMLTNYVVQGSGGDLIKAAIVKTARILPSDAYLVATVHDELIFDYHERDTVWLPGAIRLAMEDAFAEMFGGAIPGKAEVKICASWGDK